MWRTLVPVLLSVSAVSAVAAFPLAPPETKPVATLNREEARAAAEYLNKVRADPPAFSKATGADLKDVPARPALKWSAALAQVAEAKALDMATRDYFAHVDPDGIGTNIKIQEAGYKLPERYLKDKSMTNFESNCGGYSTGPVIVRYLILDDGVPSLGHRKHLLGIGPGRDSHTDIGVGIAHNPKAKYRYYTCFVIADHD